MEDKNSVLETSEQNKKTTDDQCLFREDIEALLRSGKQPNIDNLVSLRLCTSHEILVEEPIGASETMVRDQNQNLEKNDNTIIYIPLNDDLIDMIKYNISYLNEQNMLWMIKTNRLDPVICFLQRNFFRTHDDYIKFKECIQGQKLLSGEEVDFYILENPYFPFENNFNDVVDTYQRFIENYKNSHKMFDKILCSEQFPIELFLELLKTSSETIKKNIYKTILKSKAILYKDRRRYRSSYFYKGRVYFFTENNNRYLMDLSKLAEFISFDNDLDERDKAYFFSNIFISDSIIAPNNEDGSEGNVIKLAKFFRVKDHHASLMFNSIAETSYKNESDQALLIMEKEKTPLHHFIIPILFFLSGIINFIILLKGLGAWEQNIFFKGTILFTVSYIPIISSFVTLYFAYPIFGLTISIFLCFFPLFYLALLEGYFFLFPEINLLKKIKKLPASIRYVVGIVVSLSVFLLVLFGVGLIGIQLDSFFLKNVIPKPVAVALSVSFLHIFLFNKKDSIFRFFTQAWFSLFLIAIVIIFLETLIKGSTISWEKDISFLLGDLFAFFVCHNGYQYYSRDENVPMNFFLTKRFFIFLTLFLIFGGWLSFVQISN